MIGRFGVGRVLAIAGRVWLRNLPRFLAITAVLYLPMLAWSFALPLLPVDMLRRHHELMAALPAVLRDLLNGALVFQALTIAAITHGVVVALAGKPAPIGRALTTALHRLLPVTGLALLMAALNGALVDALNWLAAPYWGWQLYLVWMAANIILQTLLYPAIPIATIERRGAIRSIIRAFSLARRAQLRVFTIVFLVGVVRGGAFQLIAFTLLPDRSAHHVPDATSFVIYGCVSLASSILLSSLAAVINAVTYHQLREARDGISPDELSTVFE